MPVGADELSRGAADGGRGLRGDRRSCSRERGLTVLKADEGGYGPPLESHAAALELLDTAVERAGLRLGEDVAYAIDVAATHFYDPGTGRYVLASEGRSCTPRASWRTLRRRACRSASDPVGRGRARRGRLGRLGRVHREARWPDADPGRRPLHDQPRAARTRHRARRGERGAGEDEPDRHASARHSPSSSERSPPAIGRSSRRGPARPRTRRLPTSRSAPPAGRSRSARSRSRNGSRSTTSCCGSRRRSAPDAPYAGRGWRWRL